MKASEWHFIQWAELHKAFASLLRLIVTNVIQLCRHLVFAAAVITLGKQDIPKIRNTIQYWRMLPDNEIVQIGDVQFIMKRV